MFIDSAKISQLVRFDYAGAWIDMNEIANFCDGECPSNGTTARSVTCGFDPLNPPYKPENGGKPLDIHGIPLDAIQRASITYNSYVLRILDLIAKNQ
jgi:hypothetical protein